MLNEPTASWIEKNWKTYWSGLANWLINWLNKLIEEPPYIHWTGGSADNPGVSWPSDADDAFDPINWWKEVNFAACNSTVPCAAGLVCNNYPPCLQSWCDTCANHYLAVVTYNDDEYTFTCVLRECIHLQCLLNKKAISCHAHCFSQYVINSNSIIALS